MNGRGRRTGSRIGRLREWVMDATHPWRRWTALVLAVILAWTLCAIVAAPPREQPDRDATPPAASTPDTEERDAATAPDTDDATQGTSEAGETNGQTAERVTAAMERLLSSTPADGDTLRDIVQPGGVALSEDLTDAESKVTDLLKQAWADPDARTLADGLDAAYGEWEDVVWLVASNYKQRTITSTLMTMSGQIERIETMDERPAGCDRMIGVAHTLPESGSDADAYERAQQWILDFNDAYAACTTALQEAGR